MKFIKTPTFFGIWLLGFFALLLFADQRVTWFIFHLKCPLLMAVASDVTQFGLGEPYIIISLALLVLGLVLKKKHLWQSSLFVLLAILVSGVACNILKVIFGEARPYELVLHQVYGFRFFQFSNDFWSFPSGHTTTITALAVALSYLFPRFWVLLFVPVVLIGASRIILLMHFPSDVWTGFYVGALSTIFVYQVLNKSPQLRFAKTLK